MLRVIVSFNAFLWIVFPSTSLFLLKLVLLLMLFSYPLIKKRVKINLITITFFSIICCFLIAFPLYSEFLGFSENLDSTVVVRNILIILMFVLIIDIYMSNSLLSYSDYFRYVIYSCFIYSVLKFSIFFFILIGFLDPFIFLPALGDFIPGMVHQIFPGGGILYRLASSSDIIVAICFCMLAIKPRLLNVKRTRFILIMFFFVFVIIQSYTRFLWLLALICICYRIVLSIKKPIVLALILILFSSFSIYLFNNISDKESPVNIIATRFNDTHSLDIKMIQSQKLLTEFYKTPILGKGSGSYVPGYVRDERQKYQYENQIISSLMQFGIIGLTFLLILPFGIFFRLLSTNLLSSYVLSGVFLLFILSGFSNPNLTIISSCFIYSLFYSYKHYLNGPT
ncbi:O-antigen ligase family protein [Vibrio parahaemolyticus]|uniref:O-antigen ligase-related domain-containing protein n=2 Tax=Vibrio parahaemolyticus TaxID=670 RepID=A0A7M1WCZ7_VIBPH|nr:O-antigen ligase like membrane family protein [Vibrio parahaemolyticus VPTS-2010]OUJ31336.1 hypothetical protein BTR13_10375 [Vibrio parahaemolyticus]QOS24923.1 hypothetical protein VP351_00016 [Vibrio parahaemolyticus]